MISQDENIQLLHYILNGVIKQNGLDKKPEELKLLIDAMYEIKGAMCDGLEQEYLRVIIKAIIESKKYDSVVRCIKQIENRLMGH